MTHIKDLRVLVDEGDRVVFDPHFRFGRFAVGFAGRVVERFTGHQTEFFTRFLESVEFLYDASVVHTFEFGVPFEHVLEDPKKTEAVNIDTVDFALRVVETVSQILVRLSQPVDLSRRSVKVETDVIDFMLKGTDHALLVLSLDLHALDLAVLRDVGGVQLLVHLLLAFPLHLVEVHHRELDVGNDEVVVIVGRRTRTLGTSDRSHGGVVKEAGSRLVG